MGPAGRKQGTWRSGKGYGLISLLGSTFPGPIEPGTHAKARPEYEQGLVDVIAECRYEGKQDAPTVETAREK